MRFVILAKYTTSVGSTKVGATNLYHFHECKLNKTLLTTLAQEFQKLVLSNFKQGLIGDQAIFNFRIYRSVVAITQPFLDGFSKTKYLQILWDETDYKMAKFQFCRPQGWGARWGRSRKCRGISAAVYKIPIGKLVRGRLR